MDPFSDVQEAYEFNGDRKLLESLGLKTTGFRRERTELGTVVLHEAEAEEEYKAVRPATEIRVAVTALPAQFWMFVILRPREFIKELSDGDWLPLYEPREEIEISTGSGSFGEYWPGVVKMAEHCFEVKHLGDEARR